MITGAELSLDTSLFSGILSLDFGFWLVSKVGFLKGYQPFLNTCVQQML